MAGTITHLVIADLVYWQLPAGLKEKVKNKALFYCGNLAPDAIMARENYVRKMKKYTHFKEDIPSNDLHFPENMVRYRKRLEAFIERFLRQEHKDYELYLGYVVHILADEIFILTVRDKYVDKLIKQGKDARDPLNFQKFGQDVDMNDWRLVLEYSFSCDVLTLIQSENDYEIEDYITKEELMDSKSYIIEKNFLTKHEFRETEVFSYEENLSYLKQAAGQIVKLLPEMILQRQAF